MPENNEVIPATQEQYSTFPRKILTIAGSIALGGVLIGIVSFSLYLMFSGVNYSHKLGQERMLIKIGERDTNGLPAYLELYGRKYIPQIERESKGLEGRTNRP